MKNVNSLSRSRVARSVVRGGVCSSIIRDWQDLAAYGLDLAAGRAAEWRKEPFRQGSRGQVTEHRAEQPLQSAICNLQARLDPERYEYVAHG